MDPDQAGRCLLSKLGRTSRKNGASRRVCGLGAAVLLAFVLPPSVRADSPKPAGADAGAPQDAKAQEAATDVIVYASDLPKGALSEFSFWKEPASPGGVMVGTRNTGDELDPPPENDPHVTFKVRIQAGVPYRCWVHMKVGKPKGKSKANLVFVQFTDAVDESNREALKPRTKSYLTLRGREREGWAWVGNDSSKPKAPAPLVRFRTGGEVTVRVQAGMEGVGFDQFLLSPARFLEKPPEDPVVKK